MKKLSCLFLASVALASTAAAQAWLPESYDPPWGDTPPLRSIGFAYDPGQSELQNGARLADAVDLLVPGDELLVGPGVYSMQSRFEVFLQGTEEQPIRIVAADPLDRPVITRPNAAQNVVNVGRVSGGQSRYLVFQGLELRGGSDLFRLYDCEQIWIDQCYIHDGGGVGIAANSNDTANLYITRNEIARPGTSNPNFTGEGMYLGANNGVHVMRDSVVALNHVHDTQIPNPSSSYQGDGIEVKHGSYRNWIAENLVHTTHFPCILVYGTGDASAPQDENVIERNVMFDAVNNVLQVQGDAIVRNNVAVYSRSNSASGFQSFDLQGPIRNLHFVHNTVINVGRAVNTRNWNNAPNVVFANNVCYSQTWNAMNFGGGSAGVTIAGNVVRGPVNGATAGFVSGTGLGDFAAASWTASVLDVTPIVGGEIDNHGAWGQLEPVDLLGRPRGYPADPGAVENGPTAAANISAFDAAAGGTQVLTLDAGVLHAGQLYFLLGSLTGSAPATRIGATTYDIPLVPDLWFGISLQATPGILCNTIGTLDSAGTVSNAAISLPPVPGLSLSFWHAFTVWDSSLGLDFVSNAVPLLVQ